MIDPNAYLLPVFIEGIKDASLFPYAEVTLPAIKVFDGSVPLQLIAAAICGAVIGGLTSWVIGMAIALIRKRRPEFFADSIYDVGRYIVRHAAWLLVAFYTLPLGSILPVIAGFFGARWWQIVVAIFIGRVLRQMNGF